MKLRLFIGITAPPEWKAAFAEFRKKLQPRFSDSFGKWTSESNLHLTLRFLGSVEDSHVPAIGEALQIVAAQTKPFSLVPGQLGCFPNALRPRIVWLGFKGEMDTLIDLKSRLRAATAAFGQAPEARAFHPHLTIVRTEEPRRSDRDLLGELIRKGGIIEAPPWTITQVELIRSELRSTDSVYIGLAGYRFSAKRFPTEKD